MMHKDLIKEMGEGAFIRGDQLKEFAHDIIPVSPKINLILGGGIPGGSVVTLAGPPKCGKSLWNKAKVFTINGPKFMEDIRPGDIVCTPDGGTATVTDIFPQGKIDLYRIEFDNDDFVICSADHLWQVTKPNKERCVMSLDEILSSDFTKLGIELTKPVQFAPKPVPVEPHLLGALLSIGRFYNGKIRIANHVTEEELEYIKKYMPGNYDICKSDKTHIYLQNKGAETLLYDLRSLRLFGSNYKHNAAFVPDLYKYNDVIIRSAVMDGIIKMAASSFQTDKCYTIPSETLATDLKSLACSLGKYCYIYEQGRQGNKYKYHVFQMTNDDRLKIKSISKFGNDYATCIKINSSKGLFLTDNYVPTHNTITALYIGAKAQKQGRRLFYTNVEGRIKPRDLDGIVGLDQKEMMVIRSYRDDSTNTSRILTAEEYLKAVEWIAHNVPMAVIIIDSISQLATSGELANEMGDKMYAPGTVLLSQLTKKLANVIPVNDIVIIGIQHVTANFNKMGRKTTVTGGTKFKYAADISLECRTFKLLREGAVKKDGEEDDSGGKAYGQKVTWVTTCTAFAPPGMVADSTIRYGIGIDEATELSQLAVELGFINRSGAWYYPTYLLDAMPEKYKEKNVAKEGKPPKMDSNIPSIQGEAKLIAWLNENPEEYAALEKCIGDMLK